MGRKHPGSAKVPLLNETSAYNPEALTFGSKFTRNFGVCTTSAALLEKRAGRAAVESEG